MTDVQSPRRTTFKHSPRVLPRPQSDVASRPRVLETRSERHDRRTRQLAMLGWTLAAVFLIVGGVVLSHSNGIVTGMETRIAGLQSERARLEAEARTRDEAFAAQVDQVAVLQLQLDEERLATAAARDDLALVTEERDRIMQAIRFLERGAAEAPGPVMANHPQSSELSATRSQAFPSIEVLGMRLPPLVISRDPD